MGKICKLLSFFIISIVLISCTTMEAKWKKVEVINSIEEYDKFIRDNPKSKYAGLAKDRMEEIVFQSVKITNKISSIEDYIKRYPNGRYSAEAYEILEELQYQVAENKNTIEAYKMYIEKFPNGLKTDQAKKHLSLLQEEKLYEGAVSKNSIRLYVDYLRKYFEGRYKKHVLDTIEKYKEIIHLPNKQLIIQVTEIDFKNELKIQQEGLILGNENFLRYYKTKKPTKNKIYFKLSLSLFNYGEKIQINKDDFSILTKHGEQLIPIDWNSRDETNMLGRLFGVTEKGDSINIKEEKTINLVYEIPKEEYMEFKFLLAGNSLGKLGELISRYENGVNIENRRLKAEEEIMSLYSNTSYINLGRKGTPIPVVDSAFSGKLELLLEVLKSRYAANMEGQLGVSALMIAAYGGHKEVVNALIKAGAKIDLELKNNMSPLKLATYNGHTEVVRLLLESGASPFAEGYMGEVSAPLIAEIRDYPDIADLFKQYQKIK